MGPDPTTEAGARALARLDGDIVGWLTTINPDGQPQSSPVWYLWTDGEILLYSNKRAPRNGNIAERPLVSFHLNTDETGDQVVTAEGQARIVPDGPRAIDEPAYMAKYQPMLDSYGWSVEYFMAEYPVVVRVTPTRWRIA